MCIYPAVFLKFFKATETANNLESFHLRSTTVKENMYKTSQNARIKGERGCTDWPLKFLQVFQFC